MATRLQEVKKARLTKLNALKDLGINPYPSKIRFKVSSASSAKKSLPADRHGKSNKVSVAGRIMAWRPHGNSIFADLKDESGKLQLFFQKATLGDSFKILKNIDVGDFLAIQGELFTTKAGELTINTTDFQILTKSIRPLPSKWHGLKDEEKRYRQRYVDLLLDDKLKDLFRKKSVFWQSMRDYLINEGFLEVETPVLENTPGGADAKPFVTHHEALDIELYLRISMGELWQKRLMVAGFEKTFEIGRQFRNEGISREHLQDYTQMEFYWAYANYEDSMTLVEKMYKFVAEKTFGKLDFEINGHKVDLGKKWNTINYTQIIKDKTGIDTSKADKNEIIKKLKQLKTKFNPNDEKGRLTDILWKQARKDITGPVFLVGHPVEVSPLAKRMEDTPNFVERYQIIIAGSELGNGYSELNDPVDQAERFEGQQKLRDEGDEEAQMHDEDFVRALEYGMPPTTGFGVSERLFSFLANKPIRETVLFPLLRPETKKATISTKAKIINPKIDSNIGQIDPQLKQGFPGIKFGYAVIEGLEIRKTDKELEQLKEKTLDKFKGLSVEDISEISSIKAYRNLFKSFGTDWHSKRPSPEALLRRVVQGKGLYKINTLVDAYNLVVLERNIGLGAFDLDTISPPVKLRTSNKGETITLIGAENPTDLDEGQIVYADQKGVITMSFNYRDSDRTKVTTDTRRVIIFSDGCKEISDEEIEHALDKAVKLITKYCGGKVVEKELVK